MDATTLEPASRPAPVAADGSGKLPSYLPWLDVLRFLACFLVIVLHVLPDAPTGLGHAGVALFFSISGFLIGRVLLENRELPRFYARRFLRIYPAYLAAIVLLAILASGPFMHDPEQGRLVWKNIQYYLTFTFQLSPDSGRLPLMIVWSLCVEELFYLLLPLVFLLGKNIRIAMALAAIVGVLLAPQFSVLPNGAGTWFIFPINLFFGVLLALSGPRFNTKLNPFQPLIATAAVTLVIVNAFTNWFHSFGPVSAFLCTLTVWSLAVYQKKMPALFEPFRKMGRWSYGIYLLHLFCLSLVLRMLIHLPLGHNAKNILAVIATTALSVFAAWILQIAIEDPALRLRPALKRHAALKYTFAALQVSLIPIGILLAVLHR